jgi:hypothetical protein
MDDRKNWSGQLPNAILGLYRSAHKLLCLRMIGWLSKKAVSSAIARRELNRRMKNMTPPRVNTPELYCIRNIP